ncbi:MAG: AbrB/MazE/SpoVT family DNA-binding domain-containing protein [Firmicutes bacterium]|jgi:AbrB family looped-hinge helix DNA binding protein|nr:AbrB/MazE/SpoVT family DNA-binding domain-containing protein [Bacillota bacterium]
MREASTRIADGGRIVIPADFRKCLGIQEGDVVVIRLQDSELRVVPLRQALARARELTAQYIPRDRSLVQELTAERRKDGE